MVSGKKEIDRLYPMLFQPVYKDIIWGGSRLRDSLGRVDAPEHCAESWEITDRPDGISIIRNGPLSGSTLGSLISTQGASLLGREAKTESFPLLCKIIDARERLSVQVHPDEVAAQRLGGEPKTEMWVVLDAEPGACVHVGFKPEFTREMVELALRDGSLADALVSIPVRPGDAIFIPAGRVHAIGEGCLIFEVQQNSNTTYRLFDWNRVGSDGKPRDLHVEQALASIDWANAGLDALAIPRLSQADLRLGNRIWELVRSPFFVVERIDLAVSAAFRPEHRSFHILFVEQGRLMVGSDEASVEAVQGTTVLVPAETQEYTLFVEKAPCRVLRVTHPD